MTKKISILYEPSLFLSRQRRYLDVPMKSVALDLHMSVSKLSRIENNKFTLTDDLIMSLLDIYHVSIEKLKQADKEYEQLLYSTLDRICEGVNDGFDLISDLDRLDEKYSNIKIPTSLIIRFIVYSIYFSYHLLDKEKVKKMDRLSDYLFNNLEFFSLKIQKLFYIFYAESLYFKRDYYSAMNYLNKAKDEYLPIEKYDVLLYSYILKLMSKVGNNIHFYDYYFNHINLCMRYGLTKRLITGKINFSSFLRSIGQYQFALENDLHCLDELFLEDYNINFKNVVLYNIGVNYYCLREYEKALEYFIQCIDYWNDCAAFFNISYCLYKLNKIEESKKYIKYGKRAKKDSTMYSGLLEWLLLIEKNSYELSEEKLLNLYNSEYQSSSMTTKRLLLTLLSEQYVLMGNYELAYKYSDQLNML